MVCVQEEKGIESLLQDGIRNEVLLTEVVELIEEAAIRARLRGIKVGLAAINQGKGSTHDPV